MIKTKFILSLIAIGSLAAFSAHATLDLSKVKLPGKTDSSTTSSTPGTTTKPKISGTPSKLSQIRTELTEWVGKPGDQALAALRKKYGKEKRYNLQSYYWIVKAEDENHPDQCIEFSILVNGPNVGNKDAFQKPCE